MQEYALEQVLVDPGRFSPREVPVDPAQLEAMREALQAGETLPPLRVALPSDPLPEWWGCPKGWSQKQRAGWMAQEAKRPWCRLPIRPDAVLVDGLTIYWALREAGRKVHPCEVLDQPVATEADVLARALQANFRNARRLSDGDLRRTFERLWLGRPVAESHERWTPGADALDVEALAATLGRSSGWVAGMQLYSRVTYAVGLDLGLRKATLLGRLEEADWRPLVWDHGQLRIHFLLDELYAPREATATVPEMGSGDLSRIVERLLLQMSEGQAPAPREAAERPERAEATYQDGVLPLDWGDQVQPALDLFRTIRPLAKQLSPEQAYQFCIATAPLVAEILPAFEEAKRIAKRAGYEV